MGGTTGPGIIEKKIAGVKEKRGRMRGCGERWCLELSGEL
jgi:hypothetical protein